MNLISFSHDLTSGLELGPGRCCKQHSGPLYLCTHLLKRSIHLWAGHRGESKTARFRCGYRIAS
jgi:hypothetical protein